MLPMPSAMHIKRPSFWPGLSLLLLIVLTRSELGAEPRSDSLGRVDQDLYPVVALPAVRETREFGALGEQYAAAWLEEHGWTTLSRNWHTRYGELDIVMLNPEYTVVFVEVKSRRSMHYGYPQEAITPAKQHNLRKAACDWLLDRRNRVPHSAVRFDVVTIVLRVGRPLVHHIENAF